MLSEGLFSNQADLARHLGVSRVIVSRVMKGIRRNAV
jgi:biotin operon repressor